MHPNAERVRSWLDQRGRPVRVLEFDESTRTAAEAAQAIGTTVAQIAKSLVFLADGRPLLVIASGVNRVSVEKLSRLTGADVRRADAEAVKRHTGFPIGGVPPVAHHHTLEVLIDRDLLTHSEIWAAAGTPRAVFVTTPGELVEMTGGSVVDVEEKGR
jgi:prolyl-tRNA editing enzyme YbaK/EbsC (Cys-tRNA(Pro) deacylase)